MTHFCGYCANMTVMIHSFILCLVLFCLPDDMDRREVKVPENWRYTMFLHIIYEDRSAYRFNRGCGWTRWRPCGRADPQCWLMIVCLVYNTTCTFPLSQHHNSRVFTFQTGLDCRWHALIDFLSKLNSYVSKSNCFVNKSWFTHRFIISLGIHMQIWI